MTIKMNMKIATLVYYGLVTLTPKGCGCYALIIAGHYQDEVAGKTKTKKGS
jgi:hypothetical protein